MSHTYATLEVSPSVYDEVFKKLKDAGYDHALSDGLIDMHGIALTRAKGVRITKPKPKPSLTCRGCKAKLEFEFTELVGAYFESDWTEDGPEGVGVRCPDCKTLTEYKKAPTSVVEEVWAKKGKRR